jgi:signal peptidase I
VWGSFLVAFTWLPKPLNLLIAAIGAVSIWLLLLADAFRCAKSAAAEYRLAPYNRWYLYLLIVIVAGLVNDYFPLGFIKTNVVEAFSLSTPSMEPGLLVGDQLIVNKTAYLFSEPRRGDIAFYRSTEGLLFAKRIVGLPGETIEIRERTLFINGNQLDEPYVRFHAPLLEVSQIDSTTPPSVIPLDSYFVLGDNRDNSNDSRHTGPVPRAKIFGKVGAIFFSWDSEQSEVRWVRMGRVLK